MSMPTIAKVLAQGPQTLSVACYDAMHVNAAVKAIEQAPLGLRAEQTGKVIKVSVPRATKESREQLAKHAKTLAEGARVSVRGVRQRGMKTAGKEASKEEVKRSEKKVCAQERCCSQHCRCTSARGTRVSAVPAPVPVPVPPVAEPYVRRLRHRLRMRRKRRSRRLMS